MKKASPNSKSKTATALTRAEQRAKNRKKTHKLTAEQVDMIRSQKGKMSLREICAWFKEETDNRCSVSPSTVSRILNNKVHCKTEAKSIFDLIEEAQQETGESAGDENLDIKWTTDP
jgi:translation initiation factor 2B subunit (eIF-2B alpha/beta/delta family)